MIIIPHSSLLHGSTAELNFFSTDPYLTRHSSLIPIALKRSSWYSLTSPSDRECFCWLNPNTVLSLSPYPPHQSFSFIKPSTNPSVSLYTPKRSRSSTQIDSNSPATSPSAQDQIDLIWDILDRDKILPDLVADWPGINAVAPRDHLISLHDQDAGPMPISFACFLTKDPCPYSSAHNVDRDAKYMNESNLPKFHTAWVNITHSFLVTYTNCSRPTRARYQNPVNSSLKNIAGFDLCSEESYPELPEAQHAVKSTAKNEHASQDTLNISDLQK